KCPAGIKINLASRVRREITDRGVNRPRVENGARSDAAEGNSAGQEEKERFSCKHTSLCSRLLTGSPVNICVYHKMTKSGCSSLVCNLNKDESFSSPSRSVLEDVRVNCQRREML
ncbi:unnamed protein product, partial [Hymenolepis diminuta]